MASYTKNFGPITKLYLEEKTPHNQSIFAQEIAEKVISEDIKSRENTNSDPQITYSYLTTSSRIRKAFEIEDAYYSYLKNKLKRKYNVHQNVKVKNCEYNIIAFSKYDSVDLLYKSSTGTTKFQNSLLHN